MIDATVPVALHVGAMKTGTTYVQSLLTANRQALGDAGWGVPGQARVVRGVREVLGLTDAGKPVGDTPGWDDLRRRMQRHATGVVLSMEFLSFADRADAQRIAADLAPCDLRVLLTVRDAMAALPSQWQSLVRNGGIVPWPEFVTGLAADPKGTTRPARAFQRTQDVSRMLDVWSTQAPPDKLTVVTVPTAAGATGVLWERFVTALGVDPRLTSTDVEGFENPRLGHGSCELLRRLNVAGLREATPSRYRKVVRHVARNHLLPLRDEEDRPVLDRAGVEFAARLNARTVAAVQRHASVVGDLADLPTEPGGRLAEVPDAPRPADEGQVLRAARAALVGAKEYCELQGVAVDGHDPVDDDQVFDRLYDVMSLAMRA